MGKKLTFTINAFLDCVNSFLDSKKKDFDEIYIPFSYISYFNHLKDNGVVKGDMGLYDLEKLKRNSDKKGYNLVLYGQNRFDIYDISLTERENISSLGREVVVAVADEHEKRLYEIFGFETIIISKKVIENPLEGFFDDETMSVHIKEGDIMRVKKGDPKNIRFEDTENFFDSYEIKRLIGNMIEFVDFDEGSYIEKDKGNVILAQIRDVRTVIVKPPLSEGYEITCVRPVKVLSLDDYNLEQEILDKINIAEGVLIAGSPGSGKSTFCQAVAEHFANNQKVVKTIESPRDLQLSEKITQFSLSNSLEGDIANILLLSRPDYTIYDEMRNPEDLKLYSDLRLTGIGMVGVIHATRPIDGIHRFLGKVELGVIPQIIDTVIFISKGHIGQILTLNPTVKVPAGMVENDLARPVVEVRDFSSNNVVYEIYTYGEQTVVMDMDKAMEGNKKTMGNSNVFKIARENITKELRKNGISDFTFEFENNDRIRLYVKESSISNIIGKNGKNIEKLEKDIGMSITIDKSGSNELVKDIISVGDKDLEKGTKRVYPTLQVTKSNLIFYFEDSVEEVFIYKKNSLITRELVNPKNILKFKRKSVIGKKLLRMLDDSEEIYFYI